jgi:hypothetical protein
VLQALESIMIDKQRQLLASAAPSTRTSRRIRIETNITPANRLHGSQSRGTIHK